MIDEATGRRIAELPKQVADSLAWVARQNHAGRKVCNSVLTDAAGITIPGLTVTLEAEAPILVSACLFQFTIFKLLQGRRCRVYQLEVCPEQKRSHTDANQVIRGPHEHFGEAAFPVVDPAVTCADWQGCYAWFLRRCTLDAPKMESPC